MLLLARVLVRLLCPRGHREDVDGDLLELSETRGLHARDLASLFVTLTAGRLRAIRPRGVGRDARDSWRAIRRYPAFSIAVIVTIALGIGAGTAVFSLVNAVLLRTMPVRDPQALVLLGVSTDKAGLGSSFPFPFYEQLASSGTLSGVLCAARMSPVVDTGGAVERVSGELVSSTYFDVLGVRPHAGRLFNERDTPQAGGDRLVVLSYGYWHRRFGGDRDVIGRSIRINTQPMTIVGVTPPEFDGIELGAVTDVRVPVTMQPSMDGGPSRLATSGHWWLQIMGRRRAAVSFEQTERELRAQYANFMAHLPREGSVSELTLLDGSRGRPTLRRRFQLPLTFLTALAGLVLLLVCLNVSNLMLARNAARQTEIAVSIALGAGRGRLVQRLLVEAALLVSIGAAIGVAVSLWSARALAAIAIPSPGAPRVPLVDVPLDRRVLIFAVIAAAASALLCGLGPSLNAARTPPSLMLGSHGGRVAGGRLIGRRILVAAQIGLSLAILVSAGLLVRSLGNLVRQDVGFETEHVALLTLNPSLSGYDDARARAFYEELPRRLEAVPGVRNATLSVMPLLDVSRWGSGLTLDTGAEDNQPGPLRDAVAPGYFRNIGISIVAGREFTPADRAGAPRVAVVNEAFVRRYFGGGPALGRRIGPGGTKGPPAYTIVGVARDSRVVHVREAPEPFWYVPYLQLPKAGAMTVLVRTHGAPGPMLEVVRETITGVDRSVTPFRGRIMTSQIDEQIVAERLLATLAGAFAAIGAALASIGLYGVLSFLTWTRRREIGVRMALGATPASILRLVAGHTSSLLGAGLAAGLLLAWVVARETRSLLFGIESGDAGTAAAAVVLLAAVTGVATLLPARRASRIDPVSALRTDV